MNGKKEKEERKEVGKILEDLMIDSCGVTAEEVIALTVQIDKVFHEAGYVVSHDKINHFVVDAIKKR